MSRPLAARTLIIGLLTAGIAGTALVACSSSGDDRDTFFASTPDAEGTPEASLPEAGGPAADADASEGDAALPSLVDEPVVCATTPCATQIAAGDNHICARMSDGSVRCWGRNDLGQLGIANDAGAGTTDKIPPVVDLAGVKQLSAAGRSTCALIDDGTVTCWGANDRGQLGAHPENPNPDFTSHAPARVTLPGPASDVRLTSSGACAVLVDGGAWCWGLNSGSYFQLLARSDFMNDYGAPGAADVLAPLAVVRIGGDNYSRFALTKDGTLVNWGAVSGRVSSFNTSPIPALIPTLHQVTEVAFGPSHQCAISGGEVYCWGTSDYPFPYLGTGTPEAVSSVPVHAPIKDTHVGARPQRLASGSSTTCARLTDGTIQCCGDNSRGQIGTGQLGSNPYLLTTATAFTDYAVQVVAAEKTTCALTRGGEVQCWGANGYGELGRGTTDNDPHPTPVTVHF